MHKEIPQTLPVSPLASGPAKIPASAIRKPIKTWNRRALEFESFDKSPILRFSPTAWAKLLFLRDYGDTEVGGFGIASTAELLFVEDVALVRQICTGVSVEFCDESVADFFDRQVDAGRTVQQFARIWLHTHPGNSPQPSLIDDETFMRVFGRSQWAVMFILAQGGESYARLQFNVGPGGGITIPVAVDYSQPFTGSNHAGWAKEFVENVFAPLPAAVAENPLQAVIDSKETLDPLEDGFWPFFDGAEWDDAPEYEEAAYGYQ